VFITTKINLKFDNNTQAAREIVEDSLKMLQTDYLDLVLIHYPRGWMDERITDDHPNNKINRKDAYLELEKLKGCFRIFITNTRYRIILI
jgi:diketogulonate reductase-like aldo/keto reductase